MSPWHLEECANVDRGARCPHCGSHHTHLTRMRWGNGTHAEFWSCDYCKFWSCDDCKRSWSPEKSDGR